jgi:hypothetical protein
MIAYIVFNEFQISTRFWKVFFNMAVIKFYALSTSMILNSSSNADIQ